MTRVHHVGPYVAAAPDGVYLSPYLTCADCNALNFVNAHRLGTTGGDLRSSLPRAHTEVRQALRGLDREVLPPCVGCGRTLHLHVGAANHAPALAAQAATFHHVRHVRAAAALTLQRIVRGGLARKEAARRRHAKAVRDDLERRAATALQRCVRGMQQRQRTKIQSGVHLILWTHAELLRRLLAEEVAAEQRVFWFSDAADVQLITADYREFVRRAGTAMTLRRFEANVSRLVHRIWALEHRMATRIQAAWRGAQHRAAICVYLRALGNLRTRRHRAAVLVQRTWRRFQSHKTAARRRADALMLPRAALAAGRKTKQRIRLVRDVRRVEGIYAQYRRRTDKVAGYLTSTHVRALEDDDVLHAFAVTYGGVTPRKVLKHHAAHAHAKAQIHAFVTKTT
ncbi:hypothetical protein ACHHYP_08767 [Achlya hypogyna]|uniref:Uncharacterized protein n=1 Tax=Achlya hypogyna TaxID=1202772 RepID=A0A1V9ZJZ0_ACHHY|nr:hypothetical protein ACHHYP_08767 [Achlya hypogyna]